LVDLENNHVCSYYLEFIKEEDEFSLQKLLNFLNIFIYEIGGRLLFEEEDD